MRVYFIRHGESNYNVREMCNYTPTKMVHLTPLGVKQVKRVAEFLRNKKIEVIFASKLWRTQQTAKIINKHHRVKIIINSKIGDRKTGFDHRLYSEYLKVIKKNKFKVKPKGGESFQEEKKRVFSFLSYLKKLKYKFAVVVGHEEPIKIIRGYFKNLNDEQTWNLKVKNGQVFEFRI